MKATLFKIVFGTLLTAILLGCHGDSSTGVIVRGRVDDGTATSPLAGARCLYLNSSRRLLAQTTANPSGKFVIRVPPDVSGFVGCYPDQYPNLVLITYLGTMGAAEGETLPPEGLEEVSPRTTVVANIIAQTTPPDPQARKEELLAQLAAEEPDMTALAGAATELFNQMLDARRSRMKTSAISTARPWMTVLRMPRITVGLRAMPVTAACFHLWLMRLAPLTAVS